jgi:hypothetical protein
MNNDVVDFTPNNQQLQKLVSVLRLVGHAPDDPNDCRALSTDENKRPHIDGFHGIIYAEPGGFRIMLGDRGDGADRVLASFCDKTNANEMRLNRMPTPTEAAALLYVLGVPDED